MQRILALTSLLSLIACATPRALVETKTGPLFERAVVTATVPAALAELRLYDARKNARPAHHLFVPQLTRTGWGQRVELAVDLRHRDMLHEALARRFSGEGRRVSVEVTVVEATASWKALAHQESERADVSLFVRVLEGDRVLAAGTSSTSGERRIYDASDETLLELVDDGLRSALIDFVARRAPAIVAGTEIEAARPIGTEIAAAPAAPPPAVEDEVHAPMPDAIAARPRAVAARREISDAERISKHVEAGAGGGGGGWTSGGASGYVNAASGAFLFGVGESFLLGPAAGIDYLPSGDGISFYGGARVSYAVHLSRSFLLIPSASLLGGIAVVDEGAWDLSTSALRSAVVDDNPSPPPTRFPSDPYTPTNTAGGEPADAFGLVAARLGLGVALAPHGGGLGIVAMPYAQVAYYHGRGALLGGGAAIAMTFEWWD